MQPAQPASVAARIKISLRQGDIRRRYGSEEFVVLVANTPAEFCLKISSLFLMRQPAPQGSKPEPGKGLKQERTTGLCISLRARR
jgi:GGDEF domain-containing protein